MSQHGETPPPNEALRESRDQADQSIEIVVYESEIGPIRIITRTFLPRPKEIDPEAGNYRLGDLEPRSPGAPVVFIPGYGVEANAPSITELCQSYADANQAPAYAVSTWVEEPGKPEAIKYQAETTAKHIKEKGWTNITMAGLSEGGLKAMETAGILQDDPEIKIDGLLLDESAGLYEQEDLDQIFPKFQGDSLATINDVLEKLVTKGDWEYALRLTKAGTDIIFAIIREYAKSPKGFNMHTKNDYAGMGGISPAAAKLRMPIVLIHGRDDGVFDPDKILDPEAVPQNKWYENDAGNFLKSKIFTSSPNVKLITATNKSTHGLPFYRPEAVAEAGLYMLHRMERNRNKAAEAVQ